MNYSKTAEEMTSSFEGRRLVAYQDSVGVWTIADGHTRGVVQGMTCTDAQADAWLDEDLATAENFVNTHVKVTLTQGEYDALVDFAYNLGIGAENSSTLLKLVNQGQFNLAALQFPRWANAGGHPVAGLLRRRLAEQAEFNQAA